MSELKICQWGSKGRKKTLIIKTRILLLPNIMNSSCYYYDSDTQYQLDSNYVALKTESKGLLPFYHAVRTSAVPKEKKLKC